MVFHGRFHEPSQESMMIQRENEPPTPVSHYPPVDLGLEKTLTAHHGQTLDSKYLLLYQLPVHVSRLAALRTCGRRTCSLFLLTELDWLISEMHWCFLTVSSISPRPRETFRNFLLLCGEQWVKGFDLHLPHQHNQ